MNDEQSLEITADEMESKKWRPSKVVASSGDAPTDRETARRGSHVVWFANDNLAISLGFCPYDPDRGGIRNIFMLAESWATSLVEKTIREKGIAGLPIGCARRTVQERAKFGGSIDPDFYWKGTRYVFLNVPAMLSESKPDEAWNLALEMTKQGHWSLVTNLFIG